MKNIILIGMPGVGKSTIGVVLAKVLGYEFIDTDLLIQKETGLLLREIIRKEGPQGFMEIENEVNRKLMTDKAVIATGGSVVYCEEAMEHLKTMGTVIYLKLSLENLTKRLGSLKRRGVLLKEGQTLSDLYQERVPYYERYADLVIDEENQELEDTLQIILNHLDR